jgi:aminopeptidase N
MLFVWHSPCSSRKRQLLAVHLTLTSRGRPFLLPVLIPPTQYVPSHDYDVKHIALDLSFDWQQEQASGIETITFSPLVNDLRNISLDAASMSFSSIKLSDKTPLKYEFDEKNQQLRIVLDRAYQPADEIKLVIGYQTVRRLIGGRSINGHGARGSASESGLG